MHSNLFWLITLMGLEPHEPTPRPEPHGHLGVRRTIWEPGSLATLPEVMLFDVHRVPVGHIEAG